MTSLTCISPALDLRLRGQKRDLKRRCRTIAVFKSSKYFERPERRAPERHARTSLGQRGPRPGSDVSKIRRSIVSRKMADMMTVCHSLDESLVGKQGDKLYGHVCIVMWEGPRRLEAQAHSEHRSANGHGHYIQSLQLDCT